jgi:hypothetical protein
LLVEGASADHLVAEVADDAQARPAIDADVFGVELVGGVYELAQLAEKRWAPRALCGYTWDVMAAGDAGPLLSHQVPVTVPSCRSCLRLVTRSFAKVEPDDRIDLLAHLVVEKVAERGYAEVLGTPGQQCEALRAAIRAGVRRLGHRVRTLAFGERLCVISEDAWHSLSEEDRTARVRDGIQAMDASIAAGGTGPTEEPSWRFSWHEWEQWGS